MSGDDDGRSEGQLPDPLVPPDASVKHLPCILLDVRRLKRSRAWLIAEENPALGFYMINLWTWSWEEIPAASVEDDDRVLRAAARCAQAEWPKVRDEVLRGWIKCSDGRLYHPVVAEKVLEQLDDKGNRSTHGRGAALTRWKHKKKPIMPEQCPSNARAMPDDAEGEVEVEREGERESPPSGFADAKPSGEGRAARATPPPRGGSPLPPDFSVPQEWIEDARRARDQAGLPPAALAYQAQRFVNAYLAMAGPKRLSNDWHATWLNWALDAKAAPEGAAIAGVGPDGMPPQGATAADGFWASFPNPRLVAQEAQWATRLRSWAQRPTGWWSPEWGPRPDDDGCVAPPTMLAWARGKCRPPPVAVLAVEGHA